MRPEIWQTGSMALIAKITQNLENNAMRILSKDAVAPCLPGDKMSETEPSYPLIWLAMTQKISIASRNIR